MTNKTQTPSRQYGNNTKENIGQRQARIAKVGELLMSGLTPIQIYKVVTENLAWPVKQNVVWNYVHAANKLFAEEAKTHAADEFGKALRRLNMLFAASLKIQDYKACLAIQREINLMMGFSNKSVVEHTGEVNSNQNVHTTIKVEYIHTRKEIATNEDEVDCTRLKLPKPKVEIQDATIVSENEDAKADTPADSTASAPGAIVPGREIVQENEGVYF